MFSRAYKRYALGAMTAVYMLNLVDRGLMGLLLQPIKEDLDLSDTQLGFVTGIAFALFYTILGVPISRWADRGNRVTIASFAIGLWGLTVMSCLFVTNYVQLVFARVAAAVGEAGGKPPTYSLLGDYFPAPAERTSAMSVYLAGSLLSSVVSFGVGGWLNELYGWRLTFFMMGVPGLVLAVLVRLTLSEPRVHASAAPMERPAVPSFREVLATLWHRQSCRHITIALILVFTMSQGVSPWYAAFMMRSHGMGTAELGVWMGLVLGSSGFVGVLLGGYVVSRWFIGRERRQMRMTALTVALFVPFFVAFVTLPNRYLALIALIPMVMILSSFLAPLYALLQRLVPDDMRATVLAIVMLLANLIGMGIGPQLVGISSDLLTPKVGADALRYAMLIVSLVVLWAAWHFWRAGRSVGEDLSRRVECNAHGNATVIKDAPLRRA